MNKLWYPEGEILYQLCNTYGVKRRWWKSDNRLREELRIRLDYLFTVQVPCAIPGCRL